VRRYLELFEKPEASEESYTDMDFIRIDVTDYSREDLDEALDALRELADASYKHYTIQLHYCYHDVGGVCRVEVISER